MVSQSLARSLAIQAHGKIVNSLLNTSTRNTLRTLRLVRDEPACIHMESVSELTSWASTSVMQARERVQSLTLLASMRLLGVSKPAISSSMKTTMASTSGSLE